MTDVTANVPHESRRWGDFALVDQSLVGAKCSAGAFRVTVALLCFRNQDTLRCDPSELRLTELLGCPIRTLQRWIAEAVEAGVIEVEARRGRSNRYTILDGRGAKTAPGYATSGVGRGAKSAPGYANIDVRTPATLCSSSSARSGALTEGTTNSELTSYLEPQPHTNVRHWDSETIAQSKRILRRSAIDHNGMEQSDFGRLMLAVCQLTDDGVSEAVIAAELDCSVAEEVEFGWLPVDTLLDRLNDLREAS